MTLMLTFYLTYVPAAYLTCMLAFYLTFILTFSDIYSHNVPDTYLNILSGILPGNLTYSLYPKYILTDIFYHSIWNIFWRCVWHTILIFFLALEIRQSPLRSGAGSWSPAMPTAIESGAHCDRDLARMEKEDERRVLRPLIKSTLW